MSWDVVMIRTKTNSEMIDEIKSENIIPFSQTEIADAIKKIATELGVDYDCDDLSCQYLGNDRWTIEFHVGNDVEMESVMLCMYSGEEPKAAFAALIAALNTRLIDCPTGEFISLGKPTSFERWKAYRDKIVSNFRE